MRLLVFSHYAELYGANRSLLNLLQGLKHFHHVEICVVTPKHGGFNEELSTMGISNIHIRFLNLYYTRITQLPFVLFKAILQPLLLYRIHRFAKEFGPDVVYSSTSIQTVGHFVSKRLKKKRKMQASFYLEREPHSPSPLKAKKGLRLRKKNIMS